jgi:hypothetical protein
MRPGDYRRAAFFLRGRQYWNFRAAKLRFSGMIGLFSSCAEDGLDRPVSAVQTGRNPLQQQGSEASGEEL